MYKRLFLVTCHLLLVTSTSLAQAPAGSGLLDNFLHGLTSYSASFDQTLYNALGEELEASEGRVYLERPGKFRWEYQAPYGQVIVSDGETIWIHDIDLEQVTIQPVDEAAAGSPAAILAGEAEVASRYEVRELDLKDDLRWLELLPRGEGNPFGNIKLGFRDGRLAEMVLLDNFEQKTRIRFNDARRNPELDPGLFEFQVPDGVDVIDSRS